MSTDVITNLEGISRYWANAAQVKKDNDFDTYFDLSKKDFIPHLLPFQEHDFWLALDERKKRDLLSYGWVLYNLKTIKIESELITPSCMDLLSQPYKTEKQASVINKSLCESLTDEAYHILLSTQGIDIIHRERKLERINKPDFELIRAMKKLEASTGAEWQRKLIRLAFASVSEVLVTDYLSLLSKDEDVQDMCKDITNAHAMDEWMHSSVFTQIFKYIYITLSEKEKVYFLNVIPKAVKAFKSNELSSWDPVFKVMGLDGNILSCPELMKEMNINSSGVKNLLNAVDIEEADVLFIKD